MDKNMKGKMNALINKLADAPFAYGKNDCFTFTNALVKQWHGKDFRSLHKYKTKGEAIKYVAKNKSIEALTTGTLGYSVDPETCVDGDVVTAAVGPDESLALGFVYDGHGLFKTSTTVKALPLKLCSKGWRVK
jgi:hypothetical protein